MRAGTTPRPAVAPWTWGVVVTYVDVNRLATWHEVHGSGQPLVLLQGAFAGASSWSAPVPALARAGYNVPRTSRAP